MRAIYVTNGGFDAVVVPERFDFGGLNMDKPPYVIKISTDEEVRRYLSYYGLEPDDLSIISPIVDHYLVLKSKKFGHICGLVAVLPDGTEYQIDLYLNEQ